MIALELSLDEGLTNTLGLVIAFIIGTLAVTRMVRLVVDDDYPPVTWVRTRFIRRAGETWGQIVECPWCLAPYLTIVDLVWAWTTGLHWTWWLANLWAAVSWIVGYLSMRDIPEDQRSP